MEVDSTSRYRSRILREMNANRNNPFNSPPSSTGSHGSITLSSVFSDPEGESTRRLNEDIARITGAKKLPVNWEAAHRKWPEFYSAPEKKLDLPDLDDTTDVRLMSIRLKEHGTPKARATKRYANDDTTQEPIMSTHKTRAEMQPRVDDDSDLSSILAKPPTKTFTSYAQHKNGRRSSPLNKVQSQERSHPAHRGDGISSISDALDRLRRASNSPKSRNPQKEEYGSPHMSSAKSSMTAVPSSPMGSPEHNASHMRSFFMPDVSHLGDFVTGTLRFTGNVQNGVPILVKNGRVHDKRENPAIMTHAEINGLEVPEDEEKIFVSMDMIREEIVSLQDHYDKIQEYAYNLQQQVEEMESELKSRKAHQGRLGYDSANAHILQQKNELELEVAALQSKLEQASRKVSLSEIEKDSLIQEKDRAVRKLQEACDDISKLTKKLNVKEKELETSRGQLETTEQMRHDNDTLRRDLISLKHGRDALELENSSLQEENENLKKQLREAQAENESFGVGTEALQRQHQSMLTENKSLRAMNKRLMDENEELRGSWENVPNELDVLQDKVEALEKDLEISNEDKNALRVENLGLVRHNEKYFNDNKLLRRENSGFERSVHDLHKENMKLADQVQSLRQRLDICQPISKEDLSARLDEEVDDEENMTSAFFLPDITVDSDQQAPDAEGQTHDMPSLPDLTAQTDRLSTVNEVTEPTVRSAKGGVVPQKKSGVLQKSRIGSRASSKSNGEKNSKVAFSIPEAVDQLSLSAPILSGQKDIKRRSTSQTGVLKKPSLISDMDYTATGLISGGDSMQDLSVNFNETMEAHKATKSDAQKESLPNGTSTQTQQKPQHARTHSRSSQHRRTSTGNATLESVKTTDTTCPALSGEARRVLDDLCEHSCKNCIVCARIAGVVSQKDLINGKKRVTVPRPVPVTDRNLSAAAAEDVTMRPVSSPGHALALVIKGLEDESQHLQLKLSKLQAQYNRLDKGLGRRERLDVAGGIRALLKRLEAKNDQIYSLFDVLEGQKAAGQAMSEEEVEMTVLSITGMTVRDVTAGSEQLTWDGLADL